MFLPKRLRSLPVGSEFDPENTGSARPFLKHIRFPMFNVLTHLKKEEGLWIMFLPSERDGASFQRNWKKRKWNAARKQNKTKNRFQARAWNNQEMSAEARVVNKPIIIVKWLWAPMLRHHKEETGNKQVSCNLSHYKPQEHWAAQSVALLLFLCLFLKSFIPHECILWQPWSYFHIVSINKQYSGYRSTAQVVSHTDDVPCSFAAFEKRVSLCWVLLWFEALKMEEWC